MPFALALVLVGAGLALWRSGYDDGHVLRIAVWVVAGTVGMTTLFGWALLHQYLADAPFTHAEFIAVNVGVAGGLVGLLVGTYDVRGRIHRQRAERERRRLSDEQSKLDFLNGILRHHVLNDMNVVKGRAQLLESAVDADERAHLEAVLDRSDEVVGTVERIRTITRTLAGDAEPDLGEPDLAAPLSRRVGTFRRQCDDISVSADVPENVRVVADDSLPLLLENLLSVSLVDDDVDEIAVAVDEDGDRVAVRVTGMQWTASSGSPTEVLDWEPSIETAVGGVELAIVNALTGRYGGDVRVEDAASGAAALTVVLPAASAADGGDVAVAD